MIDCHRLDLALSDDHDLLLLDRAERERAQRFKFAIHRGRFIAAHAQARRILGASLGIAPADVPITTTRHGKPIVARAASMAAGVDPERLFCFNLTHCDAVGYLAIAPFAVGIDVELIRPIADLQPLIECYCSAAEIDALARITLEQRAAGFLGIWTRKEAVLKAWGTGIGAVPLNEVHVGASADHVPPLQLTLPTHSQEPPDRSLDAPLQALQNYPALQIRTMANDGQILSIAAATGQPLEIRMVN